MLRSGLKTGIIIAAIAFLALCTSYGALNPYNLVDPLGAMLLFVFISVVLGWVYYPVALIAVAILWYTRDRFVKSLSFRIAFILSAGLIGHGLFWCLGLQHHAKSDFWDGTLVRWFMTEAGIVSAIVIDLIHLSREKRQQKIAKGQLQPTMPQRNR